MIARLTLAVLAVAALAAGQQMKPLFNGKNLEGWEVIGDGQWTVTKDGALVGQRTADLRAVLAPGAKFQTPREFTGWVNAQSWLYTTRNDFSDFDLSLEFFTKSHGNSGVSIRDTSRAKWGVIVPPDYTKTPSKIGYEIQINNRYPDPHPTGSIYGFMDAPKDAHRDDDWNTMQISSRKDKITVSLNGKVVAEHAGDPARSKTGPIGLQLHDQFSFVMFRNIRIRELR